MYAVVWSTPHRATIISGSPSNKVTRPEDWLPAFGLVTVIFLPIDQRDPSKCKWLN